MKPTKAELLRKIDALKVCEESKPGIRDLVAEVTGIDLTPEPTYHVGQRIKFQRGRNKFTEYMLTRAYDMLTVVAVNLETGGVRSFDGVRVRNSRCITRDEVIQIFCTSYPDRIQL